MDKLGAVPYSARCHPHGPNLCWAVGAGVTPTRLQGFGFKTDGVSKLYSCLFSSANFSAESLPVAARSGGEVTCFVPAWAHARGVASVSLLHADGVAAPQHTAYASTTLVIESVVTGISPTSGPASGVTVTVNGFAFADGDGYVCILNAAAEDSWMPEKRIDVPAVYVSATQLTCSDAGAWGSKYPGGLVSLYLAHNSPTSLTADLPGAAAAANVTAVDLHLPLLARAHLIHVGTVLKIDEELLLVTSLGNASALVLGVVRGYNGTAAAFHFAGDAVAILVPTATGAPAQLSILAAFSGVTPSEAPVAGGTLLTVNTRGMRATYLATPRTLRAVNASDETKSIASVTSVTTGAVQHFGVMFDVFANRSINVTGFDASTFEAGADDVVWVMARTCPDSATDCSFEGYATDQVQP